MGQQQQTQCTGAGQNKAQIHPPAGVRWNWNRGRDSRVEAELSLVDQEGLSGLTAPATSPEHSVKGAGFGNELSDRGK
jgi:hypothetical protein